MYLRCDGPFGDGHRVSKDAIESIHVEHDGADLDAYRVLIFTFGTSYKYGEYITKEDAEQVADGLCAILDGEATQEYEEFEPSAEPVVTWDGVDERIQGWLIGRHGTAQPVTPPVVFGTELDGSTKKHSKHDKDAR